MEVELATLASILDARRRRRRRRRRRQPWASLGRARAGALLANSGRMEEERKKSVTLGKRCRKTYEAMLAIASAESSHRARTEGDLPFRLAVPRPEAVTARAQQGLDRLRRRGRQQRSQHVQRATEVWPQVGLRAVSGSGSSAVGARALLARGRVRAGYDQSHLPRGRPGRATGLQWAAHCRLHRGVPSLPRPHAAASSGASRAAPLPTDYTKPRARAWCQ